MESSKHVTLTRCGRGDVSHADRLGTTTLNEAAPPLCKQAVRLRALLVRFPCFHVGQLLANPGGIVECAIKCCLVETRDCSATAAVDRETATETLAPSFSGHADVDHGPSRAEACHVDAWRSRRFSTSSSKGTQVGVTSMSWAEGNAASKARRVASESAECRCSRAPKPRPCPPRPDPRPPPGPADPRPP